MAGGARLVVAMLSGLLAATMFCAPPALAADPGVYTLPFFEPQHISQDYGCTTFGGEPSFATGYNADGTYFNCTSKGGHFHKANDYRTATGTPVVAAAAGTVVKLYNGSLGSTYPKISEGNYILLKLDAAHYEIYYHLKHDSLLVALGEHVSAGQQIAEADNSGNSTGPHLHYGLKNCNCSTGNTPPSATYALDGKWTIGTTGRVPWLGAFSAQALGVGTSGSADVCKGRTSPFWVSFKNTGGQPWSSSNDKLGNGRVVLRSTNSDATAFVATGLQASDWESETVVGPADQPSVAPDAIATFTFGLYGFGLAAEGSSYTAYFDLVATNLRTFNYSALGKYSITVFIVPHQTGEC